VKASITPSTATGASALVGALAVAIASAAHPGEFNGMVFLVVAMLTCPVIFAVLIVLRVVFSGLRHLRVPPQVGWVFFPLGAASVMGILPSAVGLIIPITLVPGVFGGAISGLALAFLLSRTTLCGSPSSPSNVVVAQQSVRGDAPASRARPST
jgi:hypothetical protein